MSTLDHSPVRVDTAQNEMRNAETKILADVHEKAEASSIREKAEVSNKAPVRDHEDISEKAILDLTENNGAEEGEETATFCFQPREPPAIISRPPEDDKILKGIVRNEVNDLVQRGTLRSEHRSVATLTTASNTSDTSNQSKRKGSPPARPTEDVVGSGPENSISIINQQGQGIQFSVPCKSPAVEEFMKRTKHQSHPNTIEEGAFAAPQHHQLHSDPPQSSTVEELTGMIEDQKLQDAIIKGAAATTRSHQMSQVAPPSSTTEELMGMIEDQKLHDAIMKGAIAANQREIETRGDNQEAEAPSPFPNINASVPMPPSLFRERRVVPVTQPGAVAVSFSQELASEQEFAPDQVDVDTENVPPVRDEEAALTQEYLLDATLVSDRPDDRTKELVEAELALEGLEAMAHNRHCKRIAACITIFVVVVVTVPLAMFLPGLNSDEILLDGVDQQFLACGTRDRYQADYRGLDTATELGIECQDWNAQFPHKHEHTPDAYPDANLLKNYCRNPSGEGQPRAWCYTKDPNHRWAYCDIQFCNEDPFEFREDCTTTLLGGQDYRGKISVSATGKACLPWNHTGLPIKPENFPNAGLEGNYCRNPDSNQPYCFVDDPNNPKEPCDLPRCDEKFQQSEETCYNCTKDQCGTQRLKMLDYRGTMNVTQLGHACLLWSDVYYSALEVEEFGLEENYCRNPYPENKGGRPWCYTTGDSYDFCDVPICEDDFLPRRFCGSESAQQDDYRGDIKITATGKQCLPWTSEYAVLSRNNPNEKPWDGFLGSYCRNPKDLHKVKTAGAPSAIKVGAWCYIEHDTEANEQHWEYCDVPSCKDCGTKSLAKEDYTGAVSKTLSGRRCLSWEGREHLLIQENSTLNMEVEIEGESVLYRFGIRKKHSLEENYCRNPLPYQRDTVFCFVDEDGRWEYCDVPDCVEPGMITHTDCGSQEVRQADYRGGINVTVSGQPCRPWELQKEYMAELYPYAGLNGSYCRQPAGSSRLAAWCFVNETEKRWEYCDIPICEE